MRAVGAKISTKPDNTSNASNASNAGNGKNKEKPNETAKRGKFTSSFGFIMAATGSAVGLGNLWKFPYVAGQNGGGIFLLVYLVFILVLGVPIFLGETAIGRSTKLNPIGAYRKLSPKFTFIGIIGVVCAFVILSYYSVVGGWVLKYGAVYFKGLFSSAPPIENSTAFFNSFISRPLEPVLWQLLFMGVTCFIVLGGVSKGIEKMSKLLLPALFVLILIIVSRSVTLDGAAEGLSYLFVPDWSDVDSLPKMGNLLLAAMGQVFFSLSLGVGTMITYGSYLDRKANLQRSAVLVPVLDTAVAVLAGAAILPAVFAFGLEPSAGPGLLFETLPVVFGSMPAGQLFGLLFFILVFFAAITSSVSLLEVVTAFCIDNLHMKRRTAALLTGGLMALIGVFAALSYGVLSEARLFGVSIFDSMVFLSDKLLMPIGALLLSIFVGHIWGVEKASAEITNGGVIPFRYKRLFSLSVKYIAPACILSIFITSLFS